MKQLFVSTAMVLALMTTAPMAIASPGGEGGKAAWHQKMEEKLAVFPADKQALIKKSFEDGKADHMATREQVKKLQDEKQALITAPTFDKAAFIAKTQEIDKLMSAKQLAKAERMATLFGQLTQEERQKFVDMMPKRGHWGHHGGKGGDAPKPE